jgi:GNAT superfamily N-acetyltransferase
MCPRGWAGVVSIGDGILATVPESTDVRRFVGALDGVAPLGDWTAAFADAIELRGPARLAYADGVVVSTGAPETELCETRDEDVSEFLQRVPAADREEAGIAECTSPLACVRDGRVIVAAAGYRVWLDDVAHLSVLVAPEYRGTGLATAVSAAATSHALERGLLAQWRARPAASQAVARRIGYVELGQQLSLRLV